MHNKYLKSNYNIENEYFEVLSYSGCELIRQNPPCFAQLPQENLKYLFRVNITLISLNSRHTLME